MHNNPENQYASVEKTELMERQYVLDQHAIVATTDVTGSIIYVNESFCKISGYSKNELLGQNHRIINSGHHSAEFFRQMWKTISSGHIWKGEIRNRAKDGSYYWVESTIAPIKDQDGKINKYISMRTDISERKEAESRLRQINKLEAIERISNGIAHDFNNLLGIIVGSLGALEKNLDDADDARKWIEIGLTGAARGAAIVEKLADFSSQPFNNSDMVLLKDAVFEKVSSINSSLLVECNVNTGFSEDLWEMPVEKEGLNDTIHQLALNAKEASANGGNIEFKTQNIMLDTETTWSNITLAAGKYVLFEISDDGNGISTEISDKISDPFFTTKKFGSAKGLGLNSVNNFVRRHGAQLGFKSVPNGKTTFRIYFPVDEDGKNPEKAFRPVRPK